MISNDQKKHIHASKIMIVVGTYLIDLILQVANREFINILLNHTWSGCDPKKVKSTLRRDRFARIKYAI